MRCCRSAIIVIGLSLILLMIVFRSIAVPMKATLGYLLSVGAALGAVVVVFQWGWLDGAAARAGERPDRQLPADLRDGRAVRAGDGLRDVPGLGDAGGLRPLRRRRGRPCYRGFKASSRVVTAAALIMVSVFVAFIPAGPATIQQIAFGLAVGVFVDAFIVRMTLVPAVMVLLDRRAWWLPRWLDRRRAGGRRRGRRAAPQDRVRALGGGATGRRPCWPGTSSCYEGSRLCSSRPHPGGSTRLTVAGGAGRCATWATCWWGASVRSAASWWWTACCCRSSARRSTAGRRSSSSTDRTAPPPRSRTRSGSPGTRAHRGALAAGSRTFVEETFETINEPTAALAIERTDHAPDETDDNVASLNAAITAALMAIAGGATSSS